MVIKENILLYIFHLYLKSEIYGLIIVKLKKYYSNM
jgi:hypothetical protein